MPPLGLRRTSSALLAANWFVRVNCACVSPLAVVWMFLNWQGTLRPSTVAWNELTTEASMAAAHAGKPVTRPVAICQNVGATATFGSDSLGTTIVPLVVLA